MSASGKASFGFGKAKASASFNKFLYSNNYSCYIFAFFRITHPNFYIDTRNAELERNFKDLVIRNHRRNVDAIEKEIGDEVITSVAVSSELLIKIEIQTENEQQKEAIKASASFSGSGGSARANFSSELSKITNSKRILIEAYGDIPNQFLTDISAAQVDRLLMDFPTRTQGRFSIRKYNTISLREIPEMLNYNSIINPNELEQRKRYLIQLDKKYEDLIKWRNDLIYVLSEVNKKEFNDSVKSLASSDMERNTQLIEDVNNRFSDCYNHWVTYGRNDHMFSYDSLTRFNFTKNVYPRVEAPVRVTNPGTTTRTPPPARRPPAETSGGASGDRGGH